MVGIKAQACTVSPAPQVYSKAAYIPKEPSRTAVPIHHPYSPSLRKGQQFYLCTWSPRVSVESEPARKQME